MPAKYEHEDATNTFWARSMVELARIIRIICHNIYHPTTSLSPRHKFEFAQKLEAALLQWKAKILPIFDLGKTTLMESESTTKRKLIAKLRFHHTRILLHRPFLVLAVRQNDCASYAESVDACLDACKQIIRLLYDTFLNRPFFRTWWCNATYVFGAVVTVLYAKTLPAHDHNESLTKVLGNALDILQAMQGVPWIAELSRLTQEIWQVVQTLASGQPGTPRISPDNEQLPSASPRRSSTWPFPDEDVFGSFAELQEEQFPSSLEGNPFGGLSDFFTDSELNIPFIQN
ncbi:uncharacterized protein Z520_05536 [Fonsecaea multimorphosa CBS 102226]|uniref:Transcription factor domain-containing protein n=1 Tax=Fonsecaea multimorphosa CBS 102226 TaxID=1442371 RepID=A0A0D2HAZ9_9EURO|nr:uncharacterized protein Z520_05536 [Fonsecaea multimorphosa CBS 102226]KIX99075.1 hypothetical protein Z520_05536 [Fonsecaea multimorphosa CBS 102226]